MKHKEVRHLIYTLCWMIVVFVAHIVGLRCCFIVGGISNIIAGGILIFGSLCDMLMMAIEVAAFISGRKSAKEVTNTLGEVIDDMTVTAEKAGASTVTKEEMKEK